jgi:hypothetical protein
VTPFEYITVLISIILGLGISQLVTGIADMVHQWERIKIYWPHLLWIEFVFFLHIQDWWTLYDLKNIDTWSLPAFMFTIIYPINLFILARILFPFGATDPDTDFKEFYFQNFRKFFLWSIISIVLSILDNIFFNNIPLAEQSVQILLLIIFSLITIKNFQQEWMHKLLVVFLAVLVVVALTTHDWVIQS